MVFFPHVQTIAQSSRLRPPTNFIRGPRPAQAADSSQSEPTMKIVLAYSGGLDTSVIVKWLRETYAAEIVTFAADIGQEEELKGLAPKGAPDRRDAALHPATWSRSSRATSSTR